MEIPYVVTPRKDTGLFNSKIAIWLFLASEVMLFGGFFSAYLYLRLGAEHDYPWPERSLPIIPGLINTFVLIFSSVTVLFSLLALKARKFRVFQLFMSITIACAGTFMVLKGIEYWVKFHHQALRMMDYTMLEGHAAHIAKEDEKGNVIKDDKGNPVLVTDRNKDDIDANKIVFEASSITFDLTRENYKPWLAEMLFRAKEANATIKLDKAFETGLQSDAGTASAKVLIPSGQQLTQGVVDQAWSAYLEAKTFNSGLDTDDLRNQWEKAKAVHPGQKDHEYASQVAADDVWLKAHKKIENTTITFKVEPAVAFYADAHDKVKLSETGMALRDGTALAGKLLPSPVEFHAVDALDFRHLVMKAKEKGIDPDVAIKNSWLLKNNHELAEVWEKHEKAVEQLKEAFQKEYDEKIAKGHKFAVLREATLKDLYRINWEEMAYLMETPLDQVQIVPSEFAPPTIHNKTTHEQFWGPDYDHRKFPEVTVPREQVLFTSKFTPAWNTFYAIYFTMTGLHGLHVIGGALVLGYYLFFGRKMFLTNPEWLANRVEIGGLFWHFVDLVWIFLFPILYLM